MKFRFLAYLLAISLFCLTACTTTNLATTTGTGYLYIAAQGDSTITAFTLALSNGALSTNGSSIGTGSFPSAIAVTPAASAVFVANSGSNSISAYSANSDGTLAAA